MNQQVLYRYSKIELEQFAMFDENLSPNTTQVQFETEAQFSFDKENRILCSKIIVTSTESDKVLMKTELRSYFEIELKSIKNLKNEDKIIFSSQLLIQFASLCYGSLRGIIHIKTIGSKLNEFILPPIYFDNIIDKSFIVEYN
jgi:hypothetical protein